jgi:hypothetical protein
MKNYLLIGMACLALTLAGPAVAQKDDALFAAAAAEQTSAVKTLERLVNIETGTGNAEGLAAMATRQSRPRWATTSWRASRAKAVSASF